jgi:hypothetical protein
VPGAWDLQPHPGAVGEIDCLPEGPERQDGHCPPRSYGDGETSLGEGVGVGAGVELGEGGGVRRGFSVGLVVGVGCGVGCGVTAGGDDAVGSDVGDGLGEGEIDGEGDGVGVGSGVRTTTGVCVATTGDGVGTGVAVGVGAIVAGCGVGEAVGVERNARSFGSCAMMLEVAKTNAPPRSATVTIVRTSVPVVLIAPRTTWVRRLAIKDRRSRR